MNEAIRQVTHVQNIRYDKAEERLYIIDQTLLPNEEKEIELRTVEEMIEAIKVLRIRGAPAIGMFVGGAALFVLGTALGGRLGSVTPLGILVLLYLAFICGAGYLLWALLMKNNPVSRIAIFGFVNPVVNVLLSAVLNGEPLFRWQYLAALVFVCVGIWLVNKAPTKKEEQ